MPLRPKEVAQSLGISAATLRLWSNHFEAALSPGARSSVTENGTYTQRRYEEQDVAIFRRAKELLDRGLTYEQVASSLQTDPSGEVYHDEPPMLPPMPLAIPTNGHEPLLALVEALNRQHEALTKQTALLEQLVTLQSRPWYRRLLG